VTTGKGRKFDAVVLDPPTPSGRDGLEAPAPIAINYRAVRPEARELLITCSCSGACAGDLGEVVAWASQEGRQPLQIWSGGGGAIIRRSWGSRRRSI
jgi:23S rRNA G2069 N7-methylase RlmK/C1962 C5-methylase RlmI